MVQTAPEPPTEASDGRVGASADAYPVCCATPETPVNLARATDAQCRTAGAASDKDTARAAANAVGCDAPHWFEPDAFALDQWGAEILRAIPPLGHLSQFNGVRGFDQHKHPSWPRRSVSVVRACASALRGVSQVMIINNPASGAIILAGLFVPDPYPAVAGLVGLLGATATAMLLGLGAAGIQNGLYGYSGLLVGMALATFMRGEWDAAAMIASTLLGSLTTIFQVVLGRLLMPACPTFTIPFNVALTLGVMATPHLARFDLRTPPTWSIDIGDAPCDASDISFGWILHAGLVSIGQVYLCNSAVTGALILGGMAISSRIAAAAAYAGALLAICVALAAGAPCVDVAAGLWGYNGCLLAIAVFTFYVPSAAAATLAAIMVLPCTLLQGTLRGLAPLGVPVATWPFCVSAAAAMGMQGTLGGLVVIQLNSVSTAEEHFLKYRRARRETGSDGSVLRVAKTPKPRRRRSTGNDANRRKGESDASPDKSVKSVLAYWKKTAATPSPGCQLAAPDRHSPMSQPTSAAVGSQSKPAGALSNLPQRPSISNLFQTSDESSPAPIVSSTESPTHDVGHAGKTSDPPPQQSGGPLMQPGRHASISDLFMSS